MDSSKYNFELISSIITLISTILGFIITMKNLDNGNNTHGKSKKDREEWRSQLKKITYRIQTCKFKHTDKILLNLKFLLNSYGMYSTNNYPDDMLLDYEKDEHIWKVIDQIENCKNQKYFIDLKKKLLNYLILLYRFEFDNYKNISKVNTYILKSILFFLMPYIYIFLININTIDFSSFTFIISDIKGTNIYKLFLIQINIYIFYIIIYLFIKFVSKYKKWYKYKGYGLWFIICTPFAIIFNFGYFGYFVNMIENNIMSYIISLPKILLFVVSLVISYALILLYVVEHRKQLLKYDQKINDISHNKKIYIYYKPKIIILEDFYEMYRMDKIDSAFNKYNVGVYPKSFKDIKEVFKDINKLKKFKDNKLTLLKEDEKNEIKNKSEIIIKYEEQDKIYYCISNNKYDWETFLKKHLNITYNN